ncbi:hypothetical protein D3C80_1753410 [compost metagenome]
MDSDLSPKGHSGNPSLASRPMKKLSLELGSLFFKPVLAKHPLTAQHCLLKIRRLADAEIRENLIRWYEWGDVGPGHREPSKRQ